MLYRPRPTADIAVRAFIQIQRSPKYLILFYFSGDFGRCTALYRAGSLISPRSTTLILILNQGCIFFNKKKHKYKRKEVEKREKRENFNCTWRKKYSKKGAGQKYPILGKYTTLILTKIYLFLPNWRCTCRSAIL